VCCLKAHLFLRRLGRRAPPPGSKNTGGGRSGRTRSVGQLGQLPCDGGESSAQGHHHGAREVMGRTTGAKGGRTWHRRQASPTSYWRGASTNSGGARRRSLASSTECSARGRWPSRRR